MEKFTFLSPEFYSSCWLELRKKATVIVGLFTSSTKTPTKTNYLLFHYRLYLHTFFRSLVFLFPDVCIVDLIWRVLGYILFHARCTRQILGPLHTLNIFWRNAMKKTKVFWVIYTGSLYLSANDFLRWNFALMLIGTKLRTSKVGKNSWLNFSTLCWRVWQKFVLGDFLSRRVSAITTLVSFFGRPDTLNCLVKTACYRVFAYNN